MNKIFKKTKMHAGKTDLKPKQDAFNNIRVCGTVLF